MSTGDACAEELKKSDVISKWGEATDDKFVRRPVAIPELKMVGVKDPGAIAIASVRNDLAFLVTVVGVSSVLAVLAGVLLPGVSCCASDLAGQTILLFC